MTVPDQSSVKNRLLRRMAPDEFALLAPHFSPCRAKRGTVLFGKDEPTTHVWFIESGIGSLVTISPEGQRAESGLFGRDGFAPTGLVMGSTTSLYEGLIQVPDDCYCMKAEPFTAAVEQSRELRLLLLRYVQALSAQTSYTALSNAVHTIDERLARRLLMCHDRVDGNDLALTHEFLGVMLAVRRPSVTTALHVLEGNGFVRAERGCITIRNRTALEEFAGDSYGPPERECERLIGPFR